MKSPNLGKILIHLHDLGFGAATFINCIYFSRIKIFPKFDKFTYISKFEFKNFAAYLKYYNFIYFVFHNYTAN